MSTNILTLEPTEKFVSTILSAPVLRPVARDSLFRNEVENFILNAYKKNFDARLRSFLPNLVASSDADDYIGAAFGYSDAADNRLFLETYLDQPIDHMLSKKTNQNIQRKHIVEVGNLAISESTDSVTFLRDIASYLQDLGYEWIVCTATRYLRLLFLRAGTRPLSIGCASMTKVQDDGTDWGSYYATVPEILVGNVRQSIAQINQKVAVNRSNRKSSNRLKLAG